MCDSIFAIESHFTPLAGSLLPIQAFTGQKATGNNMPPHRTAFEIRIFRKGCGVGADVVRSPYAKPPQGHSVYWSDRVSETQNPICNRHFKGESLIVDGLAFKGCRLTDCRLIYRGGPPPSIKACRFDNCRWEFEDAAAQSLVFLTGLHENGFDLVTESTFHAMRAKALPAKAPTTPSATSSTAIRAGEIAKRLAETPAVGALDQPKPGAS